MASTPMIARIAPRMPAEKLLTSISKPLGMRSSNDVVELLDQPAADRADDHRAEEHRDACEPTMMPIVATAPTTPPRWP